MKRALSQWRIQGRGPGGAQALPLIFRPNWGPKSRKKILSRPAPPPPPPPLSQGVGPPRFSVIRSQAPTITRSNMYLLL